MNLSGNLLHIKAGTAKTFEHLGTGFSFRAVGDGAVEAPLTDLFSPTDNIAESLQDRRLRAFLQSESRLGSESMPISSEEDGQAKLQQIVAETLGHGWEVESLYTVAGGRRVGRSLVSLEGRSGTQSIDIEHRGETKVTLGTKGTLQGWGVQHWVEANLTDGVADLSTVNEQAYFHR